MRAVLYARFSPRPNAADCDSIESQFADLRRYCQEQGIEIVREFEDRAISGANSDRPGLWAAIATAKRGDLLLFRSIDRLSRDFLIYLEIEKACEKRGVILRSMHDEGTWRESPQDQFIRRVFLALAEMQRATIRGKTKAKMLLHQKDGRRMTRADRLPFGKRIDPSDPNRVIDAPKEIEIIKEIVNHRKAGASYREIAKLLDFENRKCRGQSWRHETIRKICIREGLN
jgi:site-specific DNA recombinase